MKNIKNGYIYLIKIIKNEKRNIKVIYYNIYNNMPRKNKDEDEIEEEESISDDIEEEVNDIEEPNDIEEQNVDKDYDEEEDEEEEEDENEKENENEMEDKSIKETETELDENDKESIIEHEEDNGNDEIVKDEERITKSQITQYEYVRILSERAKQLISGMPSLLENVTLEKYKAEEIAKLELKYKVLGFMMIKRPLPNNKYEIWKVNELEIL